ncbi:MAG: DNA (cytosine-5-)-methyltransferase [Proteobacteria bacterium]|nr:DNA (cytosine-5-)-methyltransferase [Pseudomonadota bacterium]
MNFASGATLRTAREKMGLSQAKLAELTGIPQHMLSAYELQKAVPDRALAARVTEILADVGKVEELARRKKRYRVHSYEPIAHDPVRIARHSRTVGNIEYVELLNRLGTCASPKTRTALSLFAGCGGLSLGFDWAGYAIKGFLELDEGLRSIYRANFVSSVELGGDISLLDEEKIEHAAKDLGSIDLIIGGPPCQGFSLSGKRAVNDPRNTLFRDYLRFVDVCRPRVAVLENVRLLSSMKSPNGGYVRDEIQREFAARGYRVERFAVNAKNFGVPQHRERLFFIAIRSDLNRDPSFPSPTHGAVADDLFRNISPPRTFADACSDLPYLESGEQSNDPLHAAVTHPKHNIEWLWDVEEGYSAHENLDPAKRPPSGYNTTYKRQVWLEPGATVQTTFGMISGCRNVHPIATRALTVREAARLQSFPDDFFFGEALGTMRTGIGNAVPPLLAYQLAAHLASEFL